MSLSQIVSETTRKLQACINCGRPVPPWLKKQSEGIALMEADFDRGMRILLDGLLAERDYLKEVRNGHYFQS